MKYHAKVRDEVAFQTLTLIHSKTLTARVETMNTL